MSDETVPMGLALDAAARALRDYRNVPGVGDPSPWEDATDAARDTYVREASVTIEAWVAAGGLASAIRVDRGRRGQIKNSEGGR